MNGRRLELVNRLERIGAVLEANANARGIEEWHGWGEAVTRASHLLEADGAELRRLRERLHTANAREVMARQAAEIGRLRRLLDVRT